VDASTRTQPYRCRRIRLLSESERLAYILPVYDPWFLADVTFTQPAGLASAPDFNITLPNAYVNTLICADQYQFCNPSTHSCTPLSKLPNVGDAQESYMLRDGPGFNAAQWATVTRIVFALQSTAAYNSVFWLGAGALFANNVVTLTISPSLPDDQWRTEVLGWFSTGLAKLQAYMVQWADNGQDLGPYVYVYSPYGNTANDSEDLEFFDAWQDQCNNRLAQVAAEVINFSVLGVGIIAGVSVVLLLLSWALGAIIDCVTHAGRGMRRDKLMMLFIYCAWRLESPRVTGGIAGS
jgi:hypothetical protein